MLLPLGGAYIHDLTPQGSMKLSDVTCPQFFTMKPLQGCYYMLCSKVMPEGWAEFMFTLCKAGHPKAHILRLLRTTFLFLQGLCTL